MLMNLKYYASVDASGGVELECIGRPPQVIANERMSKIEKNKTVVTIYHA
jgi:hypothetical protein